MRFWLKNGVFVSLSVAVAVGCIFSTFVFSVFSRFAFFGVAVWSGASDDRKAV